MSTSPITFPATNAPTLTSGPFAGAPNLNAIFGAPEGDTVPYLNQSEPNISGIPVEDPGLSTYGTTLPNLTSLPNLENLAGGTNQNISSYPSSVTTPMTSPSSIFSGLTGSSPMNALSGASNLILGIPAGRAATFFLGLILIAAGLFLFKGVQQTTINVGRTAAKAGKHVAEVAAIAS
jgi:hypothetical protein